MAFRAGNQVKADGYAEAKRLAIALKLYSQSFNTTAAAGPISGNLIIALHERLIADKARFTAIASITGIGAYAQDQENDGAYDVAAEFNGMIAALIAVGTYVINNVNTTGWVTFGAGGVATKAFTTVQTAALRTELDGLIAAIQ